MWRVAPIPIQMETKKEEEKRRMEKTPRNLPKADSLKIGCRIHDRG